MPPADTPRGDTCRDPRALIAVAVLLLMLRVGVSVWEERHPPRPPDGFGDPAAPGTPHVSISGSVLGHTR